MNTTQRIMAVALPKGLELRMEGQELIGVDTEGRVIISATLVDGRFRGGYTTDALGHIVSHSTVRDFVAAV
jgi:hypothetical protein